ncbi:DUF922 domain-containing protein [Algibacter sp. Ld11]|uniref:DUF922 domain-containing protein n=1 Tax=Algibacter sp. Ld11 TaxID=649150 RepID=UPI003869371B
MIRIVAFLFCFISFQTIEPVISWQDDYKLSWLDFKGEPKQNSVAVAETASGIRFGFSFKELNSNIVSFTTEVHAYFSTEKSWFHKEKASDYILEHEQLHFDLTELFARKFRKEITELKVSNQIKAELKALYKQHVTELGIMQRRYDEETDHSKNRDMQLKWQSYVKVELNKLSKYKLIE